jgi:hypothetical protein
LNYFGVARIARVGGVERNRSLAADQVTSAGQ